MSVSIELQAAKALANWKSVFADEVSKQARLLAAHGGTPQRVTLQHYREASPLAIESLIAVIAIEQNSDANQKAA